MTHLVFVYGTLKSGYHNHQLLEQSKFIGDGETKTKLHMFDVGGFPALTKTGSNRPMKIFGEVYEISDQTLATLDHLEGNGRMYQRERKQIVLDERTITAWVYIWITRTSYLEAADEYLGVYQWPESCQIR